MANTPKRPTDVIGNAVHAMRIAAGELPPDAPPPDDGKDPAAKSLGQRGGKEQAAKLTAEKRAEIAQEAATARWRRDG